MRIPWSKIYRAFPELDAFSDEECERYVFQVRRQRFGQWKYRLLGAGILILWLFVAIPGSMFIGSMLRLNLPPIFLGVVLAMPLAVFIPSAMLRDRLLIRAIHDRLNLARCTHCRHSLLGLPRLADVSEEAVRCPECGEVMILSAIGLRYAELIPRDQAMQPSGSPPVPPSAPPARSA